MSKECDRLGAFVDDELTPAEQDVFREHLLTCDDCQRGLAELMQLRAAEEVLGGRAVPLPSSAPKVVSLSAWRRRRVQLTVVAALSAAAVLAFVLRPEPPVLLADASSRTLEPRLPWGPADGYRPYQVSRAAGPRGEQVSFEAMARLQKRRDTLGLVSGHLLLGDRPQAEALLGAAPRTAELDVARAVLALEAGLPDQALELLDGVLEATPKQPQALWNRALAERDLGLPLAAAADFAAVAALGEPGWSGEASRRAGELREAEKSRRAAFGRARPAGEALVRAGTTPPPELMRAFADYLRLYVFFATVSAPDRARLLALRPLGSELDARDGGQVMVQRIDRLASIDASKRAPLIAPFLQLFASSSALSSAELDRYLARLEQAGERDLAVAAILRANQVRSRLPAFTRLAAGDPWLSARAAEDAALLAIDRGDFASAERVLSAAIEQCDRHHLDYRGVVLRYDLADVYRRLHRTAEADAVALPAYAMAQKSAPLFEDKLLFLLADVARLRNDFAPMSAYLREAGLRDDGCESQRYLHDALAAAHAVRLDYAGAQREQSAAPSCKTPPSLQHLDTAASLIRAGLPAPASLTSELAAARANAKTPSEVAFADVIEARTLIDRDPKAGAALLDRALAATAKATDTDGVKAHAYAALTLAVDAGRRNAWDSALASLAEAQHTALPTGCVLGVAVDEARALTVLRVAGSPSTGAYLATRHAPELSPAELVPPSLWPALAGCSQVGVIAPSPVNGLPRLLPSHIAWSYLVKGGSTPAPATPPHRLVVSDVEAPRALELPRLAAWESPNPGEGVVWLHGATATPSRVLEELAHATEVEIHAHGLVDLSRSDASLIVLSPDADGVHALTAGAIRARTLAGHPIVILGACHAAKVAAFYHQPWSLPLAFTEAGARAVLAAPDKIPDVQAGLFFADVLRRIRAGSSPAQALRDARQAHASDPAMAWSADVMIFE